MKSKVPPLLAFAVLALVGLISLPVVSFSGDRDTSAGLVRNTPTQSAAAGLFSLKTETDAPVVVVVAEEKKTPVYQTVEDLRAKAASDALTRLRVERLLRRASQYQPPRSR